MFRMRNCFVFIAGLLLVGLLASCGAGVPTKEMEDAKTAIERARGVDAPVFAAQDFMDAESDFQDATNFITNNQNKEAKEKADTSKVKADKSYDIAREKRADDIYEKNAALLDTAEKNFADKLMPADYQDAKNDFGVLKEAYEKKDIDATWSSGSALKPKMEKLANESSAQVEKAKSAIAQAQDRYDTALGKDIVKEYALSDLKKALPLLQEARDKYNAVDLAGAVEKAKQAQDIIDAAEKKAQDAYDKAMKQKNDTNNISLDRQKEIEVQKKKANEYIDEAKQKLEQLKKLNKSGSFNFKVSTEPLAYYIAGYKLIAQDVTASGQAKDTSGDNQGDEISMKSVEKNITLAEEAYQNQEYLDSIDYAREAIRIADILLSGESMTTYIVKLRPENRDCLWKISGYMYNSRYWLWPVIWRANKFQIQDPDLIYPGQKLNIPPVLGN
jgi:nucleoid-associated protein YgaU